jgi:hypothetical protein
MLSPQYILMVRERHTGIGLMNSKHFNTIFTVDHQQRCSSRIVAWPQTSILIVNNGLEYTALSELWRVPLTRATNADFAHHYELITIYDKMEFGG